jgi:hypothetical protein
MALNLSDQIKSIESKEALADFVGNLRSDLEKNREGWENPTLERFLEAMESWIVAMDSYYKNTGQQIPEKPSWRTFADILYAAKIYE